MPGWGILLDSLHLFQGNRPVAIRVQHREFIRERRGISKLCLNRSPGVGQVFGLLNYIDAGKVLEAHLCPEDGNIEFKIRGRNQHDLDPGY